MDDAAKIARRLVNEVLAGHAKAGGPTAAAASAELRSRALAGWRILSDRMRAFTDALQRTASQVGLTDWQLDRLAAALRRNDGPLYRDLAAARDRLVHAQARLTPADAGILQGAIDRIDLVGMDLHGWPLDHRPNTEGVSGG